MKTYGLIGFSLGHSFSEKYFSEKFQRENIHNCEYNLYPLNSLLELSSLISTIPTLQGLNVTLPYKEKIIEFINDVDSIAKAVGAINCIQFIRKAESEKPLLVGYNTDVFGFRQSLKPFLEAHHERALILGTGGGAKAVAFVLKQIGVDCFFVSRNKCENDKVVNYADLNENMFKAFKLIVNTTPVGMFPLSSNSPEIPYKYITSEHLLYDLIYNPIETEFLKEGKKHGAKCVNGLSMLHLQAEESWRIWSSL